MQKLKLFFFILFLTPLICGAFGIIHDQVTYSISPEYYTKFKFIQFELIEEGMNMTMNHRLGAAIVGFMATWWMGIPIGIMYGATLMFFRNNNSPYKLYFKTMLITFVLTLIFSFSGYLYWKVHLQYTEVNWYAPENLIDKNSFTCAGSIHNFSYLGGTAGLMAGMLYLVILKGKQTENKRTIRLN